MLSDTKIRGEYLSLSSEDVFPQNRISPAKDTCIPGSRYFLSGMCAGVLLCGMTFICALVLNGLHVESVQTPPENSLADCRRYSRPSQCLH